MVDGEEDQNWGVELDWIRCEIFGNGLIGFSAMVFFFLRRSLIGGAVGAGLDLGRLLEVDEVGWD